MSILFERISQGLNMKITVMILSFLDRKVWAKSVDLDQTEQNQSQIPFCTEQCSPRGAV